MARAPTLAIFSVILAGSCAVSVARHHAADFLGILGGDDSHRYGHDVEEPVLLIGIIVFFIATMVFSFNILIKPLTCEYASNAMSMQADARMKRVKMMLEMIHALQKGAL